MRKLIVATAITLGACGAPTVPEREPGIEGTVLQRSHQKGYAQLTEVELPAMLVRGDDDPCGVIFVLDEDTEVVRRRGRRLVRAAGADAVVGSRVRVWYTGMLETCPGQSHAEAVEIITLPT